MDYEDDDELMMTRPDAECVSRKELSPGVRLTEFQYQFDPPEHGEGFGERPLTITCKDQELELVVIVDCNDQNMWIQKYDDFCECICWEKIRIEKCNKKIINCNIELEDSFKDFYNCKFDENLLPKEYDIDGLIKCNVSDVWTDAFIKIKIQVQYENERESSLMDDFEKLLESKETCDVTFVVGDQEFSAHKHIMAVRSPVFSSMISSAVDTSGSQNKSNQGTKRRRKTADSNQVEGKSGRIEIPDMKQNIFKLLLRFIYCAKLDSNDSEELLNLMVAADKYSVKSLISICAYRLSSNLTVKNVVNTLIHADLLKQDSLKKECFDLIIKNKKKLVDKKGFQKSFKSHQELLTEVLKLAKSN